jgi:hypothetical protein
MPQPRLAYTLMFFLCTQLEIFWLLAKPFATNMRVQGRYGYGGL